MVDAIKVNPVSLANELNLPQENVAATVELLESSYPAPFIARFCKDQTNLENDSDVARIATAYEKSRKFADRKYSYLKTLEELGVLTPELQKSIVEARSPHRLEDLYLPYKSKGDRAAEVARAKGLFPLADAILSATDESATLETLAAGFADASKGVATAEDALRGAGEIIAERYAETFAVRQNARGFVLHNLKIATKRVGAAPTISEPVADSAPAENSADDESGKSDEKARKRGGAGADQIERQYAECFDSTYDLRSLTRDRIQLIDRGENARVIETRFEIDLDHMKAEARETLGIAGRPYEAFLGQCADAAIETILFPYLADETRRDLGERALERAIDDCARALRNRVMRRPVVGRRVLAVEANPRGASKIVALDEYGNFLASDFVSLRGSEERRAETFDKLTAFIKKYGLTVFAVRAGASRAKAADFFSKLIAERFANEDVGFVEVSDLGLDSYAKSEQARIDFPYLDATERATAALGRRVLNPLDEYVKADPLHLCDDSYCHLKLTSKKLRDAFAKVIARCVGRVGLDLNRASEAALRYVVGLTPSSAKNVVEYRVANGPFKRREELKNVSGISDSAFALCSGFLKITGGENPLDSTWIHPRNYALATAILAKFGYVPEDVLCPTKRAEIASKTSEAGAESLAAEFGAGKRLVADILAEFANPGADARDSEPYPIFKRVPASLETLQPGMALTGEVASVAEFGAFIDIGATTPGLAHYTELCRSARSLDARRVVAVGDVLKVWVLSVDLKRSRVSLTTLDPSAPREQRAPRDANDERKRGEGRRNDRRGERAVRGRDGSGRGEGREESSERRRGRREENGGDEDRRRGGGRRGGGRDDRNRAPRSAQALPKAAPEKTSLSEEKKSGKEPLSGFDELKLFFEGKGEDE